jgi:putative aminopeptidase FrvX
VEDRMLKLLARLDDAVGVSGDEGEVAEAIRDELGGAYDEHFDDALGNNFFVRQGRDGAATVMLCAHMDELGFVVQHVEDEGFVRISQVGFHDARMVIDQHLRIHGEKGPVDGVTGAKPAHVLTDEERAKVIPIDQLFIDLGTSSRSGTEELGVQVGQLVTFARSPGLLNGTRVFSGKAVDDRAGCAVMVETMRRLSQHDVPATVVATAAVQEEVGIRGAGPAAFRVQPNVALAIDVTLCGDTPGVEFSRLPIKLGQGPAIKYFDWAPQVLIGNAVPRRLTRRLEEAADAAGVAFQREVLLGGATDAWGISLSGAGVLTGCVSVPSRYIHSAVGCVHLDDLEGAVSLILAFLERVGEPIT